MAALDEAGEKAYRSSGHSIMVGWEKVKRITRSTELVYGGFFTQHNGRIDLASAISKSSKTRFGEINENRGISHGVEIALRMFF